MRRPKLVLAESAQDLSAPRLQPILGNFSPPPYSGITTPNSNRFRCVIETKCRFSNPSTSLCKALNLRCLVARAVLRGLEPVDQARYHLQFAPQ